MLQIIESDLYSIATRIKEIDKHYKIYFNCSTKKFEVHNDKQINGTLCFVVPYDFLDDRTIKLTEKTLVKNSKKLFDEMELNNQKIERDLTKQTAEKIINGF